MKDVGHHTICATVTAEFLEHQRSMEARLGSPLDLKVAIVSYFVEVNHQLEVPKVIELRLFEQTRDSTYRDELTGLYTYRLFKELLTREVDRSRRRSEPLSLVMLGIDDFAGYNDRNGHDDGNEALGTLAGLIVESIRSSDLATRYGREEFAVILPNTHKTDAYVVAERTRRAVEAHAFRGGELTISLGIVTFPADGTDGVELIRCADRAMYAAKERGENQVQLYGQDRRSFRRLPATLPGQFRSLFTDFHPLTTLNISESGVLLLLDHALPIGSLIEVSLSLPGPDRICSCGTVISVSEVDGGRYETGLEFIELSRDDQLGLNRYVTEETRSLEP